MRPKVVILPLNELLTDSDLESWVLLRDSLAKKYGIKLAKVKSLHPLKEVLPPWFSFREEFERIIGPNSQEIVNTVTDELDDELYKIITGKTSLIDLINNLSRYVKIVILHPFSPILSYKISKHLNKRVILLNPATLGFRPLDLGSINHAANLAGTNLDTACYLLLSKKSKVNATNFSFMPTHADVYETISNFLSRYSSK